MQNTEIKNYYIWIGRKDAVDQTLVPRPDAGTAAATSCNTAETTFGNL